MKKKIASLLMALVLALSLVPATVWAADGATEVGTFEGLKQAVTDKATDIVVTQDIELTEGLTIDELAARFYISKYHMMRRFRDETGYTIHGYVTEKRLLLAQQLLEQGIPSGEAALRCGYQEYSTFSRAYKKQFDRSPSER